MKPTRYHAWAVKRESNNRLDGHSAHLCGAASSSAPAELSGCQTILFSSRKAARDYIKQRYGYIATRPDLKAEPHGWKMPRAVRVEVEVRPA